MPPYFTENEGYIMLQGKTVLLGVTGGIAAYRAAALASDATVCGGSSGREQGCGGSRGESDLGPWAVGGRGCAWWG